MRARLALQVARLRQLQNWLCDAMLARAWLHRRAHFVIRAYTRTTYSARCVVGSIINYIIGTRVFRRNEIGIQSIRSHLMKSRLIAPQQRGAMRFCVRLACCQRHKHTATLVRIEITPGSITHGATLCRGPFSTIGRVHIFNGRACCAVCACILLW